MSPFDYEKFVILLEKLCGIRLSEEKQYLVVTRLTPLLKTAGMGSFGELIRAAGTDRGGNLRDQIVDAMTITETSWFRDEHPFEALKQVLSERMALNRKPVRLWSAACASGQEPYSMAIIISEMLGAGRPWTLANFPIFATDISAPVLFNAMSGVYDGLALSRGLSPERKQRHFVPKETKWQVRPELREMITYKQFNLMHDFAPLGQFDVIFCRNVLYYFAEKLALQILTKMAGALKPGGFLFLGGTESLPEQAAQFEAVPVRGRKIFRVLRRA